MHDIEDVSHLCDRYHVVLCCTSIFTCPGS